MGFLSGMTTGMFRRTRDGRRVYAARSWFGVSWYLISDADVLRVEQRFRQYFAVTLFVVIPLAVAPSPGRIWLWLPVMLMWPPIALRLWVLRKVPRTKVEKDDLEPVDPAALDVARAQETGQAWLWLLLVAGIAMGTLQLVVLLSGKAWWAVLGVLMFGTASTLIARQIIQLRRARH